MKKKLLMGCALTSLVFAADTLIKKKADEKLPEGRVPLLGEHLFLLKHHNRGAALNFGQKRQKWIAAISCIMTFGALIFFVLGLKRQGERLSFAGCSLLLGGALSNTSDRVIKGYVTDYLGIGHVVYNLSDFAIMIGAFLMCRSALLFRVDGVETGSRDLTGSVL
ncbi:MAG: signal peptidase II [Lachnospiraceae bacterium]|nr:signal peptidase II [Lachnospiraceae bacterium]